MEITCRCYILNGRLSTIPLIHHVDSIGRIWGWFGQFTGEGTSLVVGTIKWTIDWYTSDVYIWWHIYCAMNAVVHFGRRHRKQQGNDTTMEMFRRYHKANDIAQIRYIGVIMGAMASQITSLTIVYSSVYSSADQRKHQSSASLDFCAGNSQVTGEFPTQMASNVENVSIWWRHHGL